MTYDEIYGAPMSYEDMVRAYYAGGGQSYVDPNSWINNSAEMSPQQIMQLQTTPQVGLPNGYNASIGPDGRFMVSSGRVNDMARGIEYNPDGSVMRDWTQEADGNNYLRSLGGALAVGLGGPLLGAAGAAYASGAGTAGAAGGTGLSAGGTGLAGGTGFAGGTGLTAGAGGVTGLTTGAAGAAGLTAPSVAGTVGAGAGTGAGMTAAGAGSLLAQNAPWLMPLVGGLANAAGGDESRSSGLPEWMQPYAQEYLQNAQRLSQTPFTPYPGQGVAPLNANQNDAIGMARNLAMQGDPNVNAARQQQMNVVQGGMLNSNPYIDQVARGIGDRMSESYATGTRGRLTAGFQQSGNDPRFSSAYQQTVGNTDRAFADSLGQTMAGLYGDNYRQERNAQDMASRFSPSFGADARTNTEGLFNAGGLQQQTQQNQNNFDYSQFQQQTQWPFQMNQQYGSAINPQFGQTATYDDGVPWWARAAGGAAAGYAASRSLYPSQQPTAQSAPFPAYFGPRV